MATINKVSWQSITRLPVREIVKSDSVGGAIEVITPHKGAVYIDYKETTGMFTKKLVDKKYTEIVAQLRELDWEAKEYLLGQWLNTPQHG